MNFISRGNPDLKPERAETLTGGVVFQPHWGVTQGLRVSVDYFEIKISGVISNLGQAETLQGCYNGDRELCKYVVRDSSLYGIQTVTVGPQNLNKYKTRGVDLEFAYRIPLDNFGVAGTLDLRNLTTFVKELSVTSNTGVYTDGAGFMSGGPGGVPKAQGNVSATYSLARFTGALQARYFADTRYSPTAFGPDQVGYNPALPTSISDNLFPGVVYLYLNASYNLIDDGNRRLQAFTTINNVLNKRPSLLGVAAGNITNDGLQLYDTVGRFFRVGLRFQY